MHNNSKPLIQPIIETNLSGNILFVGNLSYFCESEHLYELFRQYGDLVHIEVVKNRKQSKSLMYGFATMETQAAAENIVDLLDGILFMGRKLRYFYQRNINY